MKKDLIVFENFVKKFRKNEIGPFDFSIEKGKITAIIGTSGSGKSVLLNSLIGAIKRYKGNIIFNGLNRKKLNSYKVNELFGFYTQMDFSLYDISAYNFLKIILSSFGIPKDEIITKIEYWLKFFDLYESKDKSVKKFSWGMKNRMNFILCFIKDPEIIIMDEPGANLDSYWRYKIKNILKKFKSEGKTIIITVHNIDEISDIIDDWVILDSGKKIFDGTTEELDLYKKYRVYFSENFEFLEIQNYLEENGLKVMSYKKDEKSFIVSTENNKRINYLFLYSLKHNLPIEKVERVPVDMESIHKALENKKILRKKIENKSEKFSN